MARVGRKTEQTPTTPEDVQAGVSLHDYVIGASGLVAYSIGEQNDGPSAGVLLGAVVVSVLHQVLKKQ